MIIIYPPFLPSERESSSPYHYGDFVPQISTNKHQLSQICQYLLLLWKQGDGNQWDTEGSETFPLTGFTSTHTQQTFESLWSTNNYFTERSEGSSFSSFSSYYLSPPPFELFNLWVFAFTNWTHKEDFQEAIFHRATQQGCVFVFQELEEKKKPN